ncbi:Mut7-C RNAse domain-containing protein [Actinopolyspora mzabensis]|uniref:Mut7-C RNAse domain-containing protein n=1 Tax=Actinopolyspora mzabensis TaxID=995066 RepID=UPI003CCB8889
MSTAEPRSGRTGGHAVLVRPARELLLFLGPRDRGAPVRVPHDGTATLGHLVQSTGVPLTEVGELLLDGVPAEAGERPSDGGVVDVAPVRYPERTRDRFVLDVHLGKLARRMRLLGIDTAYRNDATDDELLERAARQRRVLLTRDRGLLRRRALPEGAYVYASDPARQQTEVLARFEPTPRPWTRCVSCNGKLVEVPKAEIAARLEPGTRRCYDEFARCVACGRIYWPGAHSPRLRAIVESAPRRAAREDHRMEEPY